MRLLPPVCAISVVDRSKSITISILFDGVVHLFVEIYVVFGGINLCCISAKPNKVKSIVLEHFSWEEPSRLCMEFGQC